MKTAKDFKGKSLQEVWDHTLSTANPVIYRRETWIVEITDNTGHTNASLETHDTGIKVEDGDIHDPKKLAACYAWLHSVRDKYSKPDIEELKPKAAQRRKENKAMAIGHAAYVKALQEAN